MEGSADDRSRELRDRMVRQQLAARGIRDSRVLEAMRAVPREAFVGEEMVEFAYEDSPLPIDEEQTISQPYIVAVMAEALELGPRDRALDVGTGSGYAAAVLSHLASRVYTIERHRSLAEAARARFDELGLDNIEVRVGDGTLGWPEHAPYDAIQVAAGGPDVPEPLRDQLAPGGRLVIPAGETPRTQELLRLRRTDGQLERESLGAVRFVPLIGAAGWADASGRSQPPRTEAGSSSHESDTPRAWEGSSREGPGSGGGGGGSAAATVARAAEPFEMGPGGAEDGPSRDAVDSFLRRVGDARVVLLGEASHGTSEFYRMRAGLTRALVEEKGFDAVAVEADWPDAAEIDAWVRGRELGASSPEPFTRFPRWMWANEEVEDFAGWLRDHNRGRSDEDQVGFHGLDLYSLFTSRQAVLRYLEEVDPEAMETARARYECLTPWETHAPSYGRAVLSGRYRSCEEEVVDQLRELLENRLEYEREAGARKTFDAEQNARLVANAERYYRIMYYGGRESWNLRDQHMFDTLEALLGHYGPDARIVVWEHNSHLGDASATEMGARGQHNVGQLSRERFGTGAYLVGFGTHTGTVAAAHEWGDPMEVMQVRPSREGSYEHLCHEARDEGAGPRFLLPLRHGTDALRRTLLPEQLERAIGVIYRPRTELQSHYFRASLPRQFDEWIWFDETEAVTPVKKGEPREAGVPETFPFGV